MRTISEVGATQIEDSDYSFAILKLVLHRLTSTFFDNYTLTSTAIPNYFESLYIYIIRGWPTFKRCPL